MAYGTPLPPSLVCIVGPPGAGKSTFVAEAAGFSGGSVFRLREAFQIYAHAFLDDSHGDTDELGWRSDEAVRLVLEAAASPGGQFMVGPHPVMLDNFPGSIVQLMLLNHIAQRHDLALSVLELTIDDKCLAQRVEERRVCPRCHPDLHYPATVVPGSVGLCNTCGSSVVRRESDSPARHGLRLMRYRVNLHGLGEAARRRGISYLQVNAARTVDEVRESATSAFLQLVGQYTTAAAF